MNAIRFRRYPIRQDFFFFFNEEMFALLGLLLFYRENSLIAGVSPSAEITSLRCFLYYLPVWDWAVWPTPQPLHLGLLLVTGGWFILPAGTTTGGGLGAKMWGAGGGTGTTLTRGAGIMGGTCVITWPGARRTTGVTDGLGITGTAGNRVVRIGGPSCLERTDSWILD